MTESSLVRRAVAADHAQIRDVVSAAFGSGAEADLVERIRSSPQYVEEMELVADCDGEIIGHVMISGAVIRHSDGERRIVMLSPLAVAPTHQGQGVGGALVREVTAIADRLGEPMVVLEGSPKYYASFGFEPAESHGIIIHLPDWAPPEAAQVLPLERFDPAEPTLRGTVVYPPAFDGLE